MITEELVKPIQELNNSRPYPYIAVRSKKLTNVFPSFSFEISDIEKIQELFA